MRPIFILLILISFCTYAQKLPKVQQTPVRAPSDIKIDGSPVEWNNQFQAYNTTIEVYYTMSNDDKYLYLTLQATDPLVIRKIINAGITFTVNPTGNKNNKNNVVKLTYPLFDKQNRPGIDMRQKPVVTKDSVVSNKQVDSFMNKANSEVSTKAKEIKISGISDINDSLISVYNDYGIKARAQFDHQIAYNFELAIPLKYLVDKTKDYPSIAYNIQLNGSNYIEGVIFTYDVYGNTHMKITVKNPPRGVEYQYMGSPNDFWGEYILAKRE